MAVGIADHYSHFFADLSFCQRMGAGAVRATDINSICLPIVVDGIKLNAVKVGKRV